MINNNEFVDRYYPAANATRKDDVLRFLDNLNELIGDTPVKDALKNKSQLCRVFTFTRVATFHARTIKR